MDLTYEDFESHLHNHSYYSLLLCRGLQHWFATNYFEDGAMLNVDDEAKHREDLALESPC